MAAMLTPAIACAQAAPEPATPAEPESCTTERTRLMGEYQVVRTTIADVATGQWRRQHRAKKKVSGGDAGRSAAGAAASVLLPFPLGLAVGAVGAATKKKGQAAAEPDGPDVPALIARQEEIETRLREMPAC
jgi:hypothetical protein